MWPVCAVVLIAFFVSLPLLATIAFGFAVFNAVHAASVAALVLFAFILVAHTVLTVVLRRSTARSAPTCCCASKRLTPTHLDFLLLVAQAITVVLGVTLAIINLQDPSGRCAEASLDDTYVKASTVTPGSSNHTLLPNLDSTDLNDGSASCGGVTFVFLVSACLLCYRAFGLPLLRRYFALTKQMRSNTTFPLATDPRLRMPSAVAHECFGRPLSEARPPPPMLPPEIVFVPVPPPPSYEASMASGSPPAYAPSEAPR